MLHYIPCTTNFRYSGNYRHSVITFSTMILGYSFTGTGDWILQDGTWSFTDFTRVFKQQDVELALNEQKGLWLWVS